MQMKKVIQEVRATMERFMHSANASPPTMSAIAFIKKYQFEKCDHREAFDAFGKNLTGNKEFKKDFVSYKLIEFNTYLLPSKIVFFVMVSS